MDIPDDSQLYDIFFGEYFKNYKEEWNKDGSLKQRQFRAGYGRVGGNIISSGQVNKPVEDAIKGIVLDSLVQNYERLVKGSSEPTGTLLRAIKAGEFTPSQDDYEGFTIQYSIADMMRTRSRSSFLFGNGRPMKDSYNSTRKYGPVIFQGRQAIVTANKMVFPAYAGRSGIIQTRSVKAVAPANIFELTSAQNSALIMSVMPGVAKAIQDNIHRACSE